ncbi:hypothetical protein B0A50_04322 [Salinomyces thailandicus]|uniref:ATPase AAA-type core domain-containing protein n=1 Tax=Salinomyces thailandicus TaxID=706561 RepID=A0A4U0TXY0_9PEZI|nr:hypothetical protein B0A50_04322 [Salinomyces thailandica]
MPLTPFYQTERPNINSNWRAAKRMHADASKPQTTDTPFTTQRTTQTRPPAPPTASQGTQDDLRLPAVYLTIHDIFHPKDSERKPSAQAFPTPFSTETLAAAIAESCSLGAIKQYLAGFPRAQIERDINHARVRKDHPVLFYALERNDVEIVRLLLEYGCDAKAVGKRDVPALAFAVMRSKWTAVNPTEVVKTLLGCGAEPGVVPKDMWMECLEPPAAAKVVRGEERDGGVDEEPEAMWCEPRYRKILAETLNLSIRYFLHKASQLTRVKARGRQLAQAHEYVALLKVPYLVIGQTFACKFVVEHVTSHVGMGVQGPLVLTFAGMSGHGKTELAKQMETLLQLPIAVVDCAQMRSDFSLFGSRNGYLGNEIGSQLNNHLAAHDGQRSVVFLDEFDKTDHEVRNSLLLLLDSGDYHDRRTNQPVDASKVIWILATNLGDKAIGKFYTERLEAGTEIERLQAPHKLLQSKLMALFRDNFGAPMAGRMKNIAPFYPFDEGEQAVVAHKFLLELADQLRRPIDTSLLVKRFAAHVHLVILSDGKLCRYIAAESYIAALGARSLVSGVDEIRRDFYTTFIDSEVLVEDAMNEGPLARFSVGLVAVDGDKEMSEVSVRGEGFSEYYRGQKARKGKEHAEMGDGLDDLNGALVGMMRQGESDDEEDEVL